MSGTAFRVVDPIDKVDVGDVCDKDDPDPTPPAGVDTEWVGVLWVVITIVEVMVAVAIWEASTTEVTKAWFVRVTSIVEYEVSVVVSVT
jgi:hypothetical protein